MALVWSVKKGRKTGKLTTMYTNTAEVQFSLKAAPGLENCPEEQGVDGKTPPGQ